MKKILFPFLPCFCTLAAQAQTFFYVDGVRYLIEDDHAVVARQDKELAGNIVIPATVDCNGTPYDVTGMVKPTLCDVYSDATVEVEGGAFQECKITGISLPASIQVIEAGAFSGCTDLVSVNLPEGLKQIGAAAFSRCTSLTSITIPSTVTDLGSETAYGYASYAFGDCPNLNSMNIPEGVTILPCGLLRGTAITELTIPTTVTNMDRYSLAIPTLTTLTINVRDPRTLTYDGFLFGEGDKLRDVSQIDLVVPNGSKDIYGVYDPWMNFKSISQLDGDEQYIRPDKKHIVADNGVKYIINLTFNEDNTTSMYATVDHQDVTLSGAITIPETVTFQDESFATGDVECPVWDIVEPITAWSINGGLYETTGGAFQGTQITEIQLPGFQRIPSGTFADCTLLEKATLTRAVDEMGAACFANCTQLTTVDIQESLNHIGTYAFGNCTSLKTMVIPSGVTSLADGLFKGSGIETLTIPAAITSIGECTLEMPSLKTLTLMQPDKEQFTIRGDAFGTNNSILQHTDLIVPLGSAQVYQEYYPWINCRSITDVNCYYLKLNNSVLSAPANIFTVEDESMEFEFHGATYDEDYTYGLCIDTDTQVKFTTTTPFSWVYAYIFCSNNSKVTIDGEVMETKGEDQCEFYSYYSYDKLVGPGNHTITCNGYEGDQVPVIFLLRVEDESATERFEPEVITTRINHVRYILKETTEDEVTTRTATIGRQNTDLSGDIVVPASVEYDGKEYTVTAILEPSVTDRYADETVEVIDGAFQGTAITGITLPATITRIPTGAFFECRQLENVTLPDGLKQISAAAFARCENLVELFIPETVTDLGGETNYGYTSYVFGGCTNLKKVNIPTGVTTLSYGIFKDSGLETFLVPASVTTLAPYSFVTRDLREFKLCHNQVNDLAFTETVFKDVDLSQIILYVPTGAKNTFIDEYPWKNFMEIIEYTDQNDAHQYNAYRVEYEEVSAETPAAIRGLRKKANEGRAVTMDYIPSGIALELPTEIERNGMTYTVTYKNSPDTMPAEDIHLKVVLTPVGNDVSTGVSETLPQDQVQGNGCYTLDGRKLNGKPKTAGVYIMNGKKVVMK